MEESEKMDNKFRSKSEIADALGIPRNTFSSYYTGHRPIATIENRKKLFEMTGIEYFKSEKPNEGEIDLLKLWIDSVIDIKDKDKQDKDKQDKDKQDKDKQEKQQTFNNSSDRPFFGVASELRNWFLNQDQWKTKQEFADYIGVSRSTMKKIFLGFREPKGDAKKKLYDITKLECFKVDDQQSQNTEQVIDVQQQGDIQQDAKQPVIGNGEDKSEKLETLEKSKVEESVQHMTEQPQQSIDVQQPVQPVTEIKEEKSEIHKVEESIHPVVGIEPKMVKTLKEKTKMLEIVSGDDVDKLVNLFYSLAKALGPFKHGTPEQRKKIKNKIPPEDLGYVTSFLKAIYDEDNFSDFIFFSEYHMKGENIE